MIFNKETFLNGEFAVCPGTWEEKCKFIEYVTNDARVVLPCDEWLCGNNTCYWCIYSEETDDYLICETDLNELIRAFDEPAVVISCDQFEYDYVAPPKAEEPAEPELPNKLLFDNREFANGNLAVVCSTYEDSISFLHILKNLGYKWLAYGGELSEDTGWERYKTDTAYVCARGTKKVGPVPKFIPEMLGSVSIVDFQDLAFDESYDEEPEEDAPNEMDIVEKELDALMKRLFGDGCVKVVKKTM